MMDPATGFELNRFALRCTYLVVLAAMVGYLCEQEKAGRAQAALLARTLASAQQAGTFSATFRIIADSLLQLFRARKLQLFAQEAATGRGYLWTATPAPAGGKPDVHMAEVAPAEWAKWTKPASAPELLVVRSLPDGRCELLAAAPGAHRLTRLADEPPSGWCAGQPSSLALNVSQRIGGDWYAELLLFDPDSHGTTLDSLQALAGLSRNLGPVLHNAYLVSRLRSRISAVERARVARDLHDGAIQSMLGLRLRVEALRGEQPQGSPLRSELAQMEAILQHEAHTLRMLMFQLAPPDHQAGDLGATLMAVVERFERDSGISTRFVTDIGEACEPPPRLAFETARILQEALVNVQKHSGARHVVVRWSTTATGWVLVIDDDGCGFEFSGRLSHDSLDQARRGPRVIKERVRLVKGSLAIESTPGCGARLEIAVPRMI